VGLATVEWWWALRSWCESRPRLDVVGDDGLEPPTYRVSHRLSSSMYGVVDMFRPDRTSCTISCLARTWCTVRLVTTTSDRHNKRHTARAGPKLGRVQRVLLLRVLHREQETGQGRVLWQPLMRQLEAEGENKKSLANTLRSLADRRLVMIERSGSDRGKSGRLAKSVELTEPGRERALELVESKGVTHAMAERARREQRPLHEVSKRYTNARKLLQELLLYDVALANELQRLFGEDPELGSGSVIEEAAKRYLLLARSMVLQDFARRELGEFVKDLDEPVSEGSSVVGAEFAWTGGMEFNPNDPLTRAQIDLVRDTLLARLRRSDD